MIHILLIGCPVVSNSGDGDSGASEISARVSFHGRRFPSARVYNYFTEITINRDYSQSVLLRSFCIKFIWLYRVFLTCILSTG